MATAGGGRTRTDDAGLPTVCVAVLAKDSAATLPLYLECLWAQDYPRALVSLYVRTNNNRDDTLAVLRAWLLRRGAAYARVELDPAEVPERVQRFGKHEWNPERFRVLAKIRTRSLRRALEWGCALYYVADCDNFTAPGTLRALARAAFGCDAPIVAPLLRTAVPDHPYDTYSNVHCAVDAAGYYAECPLYWDVMAGRVRGLVRVPVVHCTYAVRADAIPLLAYDDGSDRHEYVVFAESARRARVAQYLDCRRLYGYVTMRERSLRDDPAGGFDARAMRRRLRALERSHAAAERWIPPAAASRPHHHSHTDPAPDADPNHDPIPCSAFLAPGGPPHDPPAAVATPGDSSRPNPDPGPGSGPVHDRDADPAPGDGPHSDPSSTESDDAHGATLDGGAGSSSGDDTGSSGSSDGDTDGDVSDGNGGGGGDDDGGSGSGGDEDYDSGSDVDDGGGDDGGGECADLGAGLPCFVTVRDDANPHQCHSESFDALERALRSLGVRVWRQPVRYDARRDRWLDDEPSVLYVLAWPVEPAPRRYVAWHMEQRGSPNLDARYAAFLGGALHVWCAFESHVHRPVAPCRSASWLPPLHEPGATVSPGHHHHHNRPHPNHHLPHDRTATAAAADDDTGTGEDGASGDKGVDVLFYGAVTPYRARTLARLQAYPALRVAVHDGTLYGAARERAVARARIVLNLRRDASHLDLETHRLHWLMARGACVVSERSADPALDALYRGAIALVPACLADADSDSVSVSGADSGADSGSGSGPDSVSESVSDGVSDCVSDTDAAAAAATGDDPDTTPADAEAIDRIRRDGYDHVRGDAFRWAESGDVAFACLVTTIATLLADADGRAALGESARERMCREMPSLSRELRSNARLHLPDHIRSPPAAPPP